MENWWDCRKGHEFVFRPADNDWECRWCGEVISNGTLVLFRNAHPQEQYIASEFRFRWLGDAKSGGLELLVKAVKAFLQKQIGFKELKEALLEGGVHKMGKMSIGDFCVVDWPGRGYQVMPVIGFADDGDVLFAEGSVIGREAQSSFESYRAGYLGIKYWVPNMGNRPYGDKECFIVASRHAEETLEALEA